MSGSHFSEVRWYSEISTAAFCESLDLRRALLENRQSLRRGKRRTSLLEPASAEFISALAAGINSRHTLQIGCGLSTLALAAAARATNSILWSLHHEQEKQQIVQHFLRDLGLIEYVQFITGDPSTFIPQREGVEFVLLSGLPDRYIELFDLLKLKKGAIVVADNALDDSTNEYIRHVRRQPGVDSSTLPLSRGIEVTKIVTWEEFKVGRKLYGGINDPINDKDYISQKRCVQGAAALHAPVYSSDPLDSVSSDVSPRNSSDTVKPGLVELKQKKYETSDSGRECPVSICGLDGIDHVSPAAAEPSRLESSNHDIVEKQFKTFQSLADQWRLRLAVQGESTGTSVESSNAAHPGHLHDKLESYSTASEVSLDSPEDVGTGALEHESILKVCDTEDYVTRFHWQLPMDTGNNDDSLPSSDMSMADKVAPEPLEPANPVLSVEYEEPVFEVHFRTENGQTEITVKGIDHEMLLLDLTLAFNEAGLSVKKAKISTEDIYVLDVFYVVDGETKKPLQESRWEAVRKCILEQLTERRKLLHD